MVNTVCSLEYYYARIPHKPKAKKQQLQALYRCTVYYNACFKPADDCFVFTQSTRS